MSRYERRNFMPLDAVQEYCRALEISAERPVLYKLTSAIRTVDKALELAPEMLRQSPKITQEAWSTIRDSLFNRLVCSFPGYFVVFTENGEPLEAGWAWPDTGRIEFYPESGRRREDCYHAWLERMDPDACTVLRWCLAEGRQFLRPDDFANNIVEVTEEQANDLLERLYEICQQEARQGKKRAHQAWWRLYWEADSCRDKKQQHSLRKQMIQLQSVWGKPS